MSDPMRATRTSNWRRYAVWAGLAVNVACVLLLPVLDRYGLDGVKVLRAGETLTYRLSPLWLIAFSLPIGFMGICAAAGLTLPSAESRFTGGVFLFFAITLSILMFPAVWTYELIVTPDGFTHVCGGWWAPETQTVRFETLTSITAGRETDAASRSSDLEFRRRDGTTVAIPKSHVLKAGLTEILVRAARAGVPIDRGEDLTR